jgi:hypothetical protein
MGQELLHPRGLPELCSEARGDACLKEMRFPGSETPIAASGSGDTIALRFEFVGVGVRSTVASAHQVGRNPVAANQLVGVMLVTCLSIKPKPCLADFLRIIPRRVHGIQQRLPAPTTCVLSSKKSRTKMLTERKKMYALADFSTLNACPQTGTSSVPIVTNHVACSIAAGVMIAATSLVVPT